DRATMLAALAAVDHVTIFPEDTPLRTIQLLRPDVLVKGADWGADAIVGSREVASWGGRTIRVALKRGFSTTRIVERILAPRDPPDPRAHFLRTARPGRHVPASGRPHRTGSAGCLRAQHVQERFLLRGHHRLGERQSHRVGGPTGENRGQGAESAERRAVD